MNFQDYRYDILIPVTDLTTNILEAVRKNAPRTKRIIVTSSFASIVDLEKWVGSEYIYIQREGLEFNYPWCCIRYLSINPNVHRKLLLKRQHGMLWKETNPTTVCRPCVPSRHTDQVRRMSHRLKPPMLRRRYPSIRGHCAKCQFLWLRRCPQRGRNSSSSLWICQSW